MSVQTLSGGSFPLSANPTLKGLSQAIAAAIVDAVNTIGIDTPFQINVAPGIISWTEVRRVVQ